MAKKLTKSELKKIWISTQRCYCKALYETYPEELKSFNPRSFGRYGYDRDMKAIIYDNGLEAQSEDIHRKYMTHVLNLTTDQLNKILEASAQGGIKRAPGTIDEISYELLNRSVRESEEKA